MVDEIEIDETLNVVQPIESCAFVALVDAPDLDRWRGELVEQLCDMGIFPVTEHGFVPHITLGYGPLDEAMSRTPPPAIPLELRTVVLTVGGQVARFPIVGHLLAGAPMELNGPMPDLMMAADLLKANVEQRVTVAPLYVPGAADSHGDIAAVDELESAVAEYLAGGDMTINLQHVPEVSAGRCIGVMAWPYPVTAEMTTGDGTVRSVSLPAGTVYQAVKWNPWAWELVKTGKIRGMSLEGSALRVPAS
jgi:hypothetical protein